MHGIVKPFDIIISTQGTEWHGLAEVKPFIDRTVAAPLLFPIRTGPMSTIIDGRTVAMPSYKTLVADLRGRTDLTDENQLVPLHVPKEGYEVIDNGVMWETAANATDAVGAELTCIGTLQACRKFFLSYKLAEDGGSFEVNGDKYLAHLNIITSHDGTLAAQVYDSTVRIVCTNTLRWSLQSKGALGGAVYHTKNAGEALKNLAKIVNQALLGRAKFRSDMEYLASVSCDIDTAELIMLGYFASETGSAKLATKSKNAAAEIAMLFTPRGLGNFGRSLYDVLNAATQYWTTGDGTGKVGKANVADKVYRANFGTAADHKQAIHNALLSPATVERLIEAGHEARLELAKV